MKQWIIPVALLLVVVLGAGALAAWGYFAAMKRGWIRYNEYDIRSEGILVVGDAVPDLELRTADGAGMTRLSELYRERPLVLVFGSYT